MAEQLTPILNLANTSPVTLIALANAIVNVMASTMVTANGSANGGLTNGNGYVSGIFGASTLVTNYLRGGNVASSANLYVGSNVVVNGGSFAVGNSTVYSSVTNTQVTSPVGAFTNATVGYFNQASIAWANSNMTEMDIVTTGTSQVTLDSFPLTSFRSAEYTLQVRDNAANGFQTSKLLLTHDGTNALWTEYGLLTTNTVLATFQPQTNATTLILKVTPVSSNTTIRALRTALNA